MRRDDPEAPRLHAHRGWRGLPAGAAAAAAVWLPWLCERGSLSALLRAHGLRLRVLRLREGCRATLGQAGSGCPVAVPGQRPWIREVLLELDGRALVWACSSTAPGALRGAWRGLHRVAGRPLGDWLFACPQVHRGPIEVRRLAPSDPMARRAWSRLSAHARERGEAVHEPAPVLWARRSAFLRRGRALWVTEVFLPEVARLSRR